MSKEGIMRCRSRSDQRFGKIWKRDCLSERWREESNLSPGSSFPHRRRRERGMAIPLVLLAMVILVIVGFSLSSVATQHAFLVNQEGMQKAAFGQAYAGLSQALYYLSTITDWNLLDSDPQVLSNISRLQYGTGVANNPKSGNDPNRFYRVEVTHSLGDKYTAQIRVRGLVVRRGNPADVILRRTLSARVHQEGPKSLSASIFTESCITTNGNPTVDTDGIHKVVTFCPQDPNLTVTPPGAYYQVPLSEKDDWFMPRINEPAVILTAQNNTLNTYKPPRAPITGHYFDPAYMFGQLSGRNGNWMLDSKLKDPGGLSGTILVDISRLPPGDNSIRINTLDSDSLPPPPAGPGPLPGHNLDTNPNILIVKGGDLEITGNVTYYGVILVLDGRVKGNGNFSVHGAVFARDGFISGGAAWDITYDWEYVRRFAVFVLRKVVVDAMWVGEN